MAWLNLLTFTVPKLRIEMLLQPYVQRGDPRRPRVRGCGGFAWGSAGIVEVMRARCRSLPEHWGKPGVNADEYVIVPHWGFLNASYESLLVALGIAPASPYCRRVIYEPVFLIDSSIDDLSPTNEDTLIGS